MQPQLDKDGVQFLKCQELGAVSEGLAQTFTGTDWNLRIERGVRNTGATPLVAEKVGDGGASEFKGGEENSALVGVV